MTKPTVQLIGQDGNAFMILGLCRKAAIKAGWDKEKIDSVLGKMMEGDYSHLLNTAGEHFNIE